MRLVMVLALVAVIAAMALQAGAPRSPVAAGLDALAGTDDVRTLEAVLAAGRDPHAFHGRDLVAIVHVPEPGPDPIDALYELSVVLQTDVDPRAWQDPVRGEVDLIAQLEANIPRAMESDNDAVLSFQLIAMAHAGLERHEAVADLRIRLLSLQHDDGSWGCGPWVGPECTSYALRGLRATGLIPADVRDSAVGYIEGRLEGDLYSDPLNGADVQITAAAIRGLVAAGATVPAHVIDGLVERQQGGWWYKAGRPSAWATSEVIVALSEAS